MKYTAEERLEIGRQIYDGELSRYQAEKLYDMLCDIAATERRRSETEFSNRFGPTVSSMYCQKIA